MKSIVVALALATGACTWFDAGPPERTCQTDRDCFRAQGEVCYQPTHTCELSVDGGADVDAP